MNPSDKQAAQRLLVRGIAAAKAKEFKTARDYFERVIRHPSSRNQDLEAYHWLAEISATHTEKREYLIRILSLNPGDPRAKRSLAVLDGQLDEDEIIDPNSIENAPEGQPVSTPGKRYVCPNCGSRMQYSPDGANLVCENCSTSQAMLDEDSITEQDFIISMATSKGHSKPVAARSFACEACGAVYLLDPERISLTCAHCDAVYSIENATKLKLIPPEGIIPFSIPRDQAETAIQRWLISKKIRKSHQIVSLQGVYLPAWTFDLSGVIPYSYERYQNEQWVTQHGTETAHFNDIMITASTPLPTGLIELLPSFNLNELKAFKPDYLADWLAETYTIKLSDAALDARATVLDNSRKNIKLKSHTALKDLRLNSSNINIQTYKLILLPVWIAKYRIQKTEYAIVVNGQTGDVFGDHPPTGIKKLINWLLE